MEQSRISTQESSQTTHASRLKKADKPAEAAPDPTAGGFVALMAALGAGSGLDGASDISNANPLAKSAKGAVDLVDPGAGTGVQGILTANLLASGFDKTMLKGTTSGTGEFQVGNSNVMWPHDPATGGLVAQTAALDGVGDIKDGDAAAMLLTQGRPQGSRFAAAIGPRGEMAQVTGVLTKGVAVDVTKVGVQSADVSGTLASVQPSIMRDPAMFQSTFAREQTGRAEIVDGFPSGVIPGALTSVGEVATVGGRFAADLGNDSSAAGYAGEGTWGASLQDAPRGLQDLSKQDNPVFSTQDDALAEQVTYWVNQKSQNAEVTLSHDGRPVEVSVTLFGNEAHVSFRSDQAHTRQMLDGNMVQLSDMLRDQGLMLSGSSVGTSGQEGRGSSKENPASEGDSPMRQAKVEAANVTAVHGSPASAGSRSLDIFV